VAAREGINFKNLKGDQVMREFKALLKKNKESVFERVYGAYFKEKTEQVPADIFDKLVKEVILSTEFEIKPTT
jgi:hypothetical protein